MIINSSISESPIRLDYEHYLLLQDHLLVLQRDAVVMLDRDHNGVDSLRDDSSVLLLIMYSDLWDGPQVKLGAQCLNLVVDLLNLQFLLF